MDAYILSEDVAVVLGGGLSADGAPSVATVLRAEAGAEFASAHPSTPIILSGGNGHNPGGDPNEASIMARIFEEHGIDASRLFLEDESVDTIGNAILVSWRYLQKCKPRKLYVITSPFHAERACGYFRSTLGPEWEIVPVHSQKAPDDDTRAATESGGIEWGKQFFNGITPGDITSMLKRLREQRPVYEGLALGTPESEAIAMCMLHHENGGTVAVKSYRLPDAVAPIHYALTLRPDLDTSAFTGEQVVDIRVRRATSEIVLNAVGLNITNVYVVDDAGTRLNGKVTLNEETEQATFTFDGVVGKGVWKLHMDFAGAITNKLNGFYRSTYKDAAGKERVIASTQFEPNDARRAFPCWDEPSYKATFGITLEVAEHLTAISNGPIVSEELVEVEKELSIDHGNGLKMVHRPARNKRVVRFADTMKMSTYIVAFVIGEFEVSDTIVVNGTEVRVFCIPGKKDLATFALKAAQFSLTWFEKYFGIRYPGDKLDLIGIPDFAFGAMENLGCVTFRETALLVNEKTATIGELSRVAEVVAHEIAHMWFGNLVTMKWWNGLWLNEAFATFMATKVENDFRPQWERWTSFGMERAAAFATDGLGSTRSIEAPVDNPASALGMIDVITYRKGCSVLRQLEQFIGETTFRDGIRAYLKKHSYANAETTDLWDAIESVCDYPVREIMTSWIFQPGYPVVSVTESEVDGCVTLAQAPFKYLTQNVDPAQLWLVPVHLRFKSADGVQERWELLDTREMTVYLGEKVEWVVANAGGHGFYRVRYSPSLAAKVTSNISGLAAIERFNLVNDAWACVKAGIQSGEEFLDIAKLFSAETDPNVWGVLSSGLHRLHDLLPERNRMVFAALVRDLVTPAYKRLGWEAQDSDTPQDRQVRGTVIAMLGTIGHDSAVADKAKKLFAAYKTDRSAVASDVVPAVISLVAYTGGAAEYDELFNLFQTTKVPQEQVRFLGALASFRDAALLERTLNATITPTVRTQDAPSLLVRLLGNKRISTKTWDFIKKNWAHMVANYPETGLISMVSGVTALDQAELEQDVIDFFAQNPVKGGEKKVAQNLEQLRIEVQFKQREAGLMAVKFALPVVTPLPDVAPVVDSK